jgi:hypothetical protein
MPALVSYIIKNPETFRLKPTREIDAGGHETHFYVLLLGNFFVTCHKKVNQSIDYVSFDKNSSQYFSAPKIPNYLIGRGEIIINFLLA